MTRWIRWVGLLALVGGLWGCAGAGPRQPDHSFSYDGWFDGWAEQVDLLEYSYGDKERSTRDVVKPGSQTIGYRDIVSGSMPIGEFLYVKWRIKATGEVLEDRVDLHPVLPWNMGHHTVTFVIEGRQL